MLRRTLLLAGIVCIAATIAFAQTASAPQKPAPAKPAPAKPAPAKPAPARPAPAPAAPRIEDALVTCPSPLGTGVETARVFCDVPIGRTPADGITVTVPPHKGPAVLTFDLHNRQTYSEDQVKARKAYARLTATVGVMTMDNTLITRAVIQSEFRTAADLFDRIGGGAGPGGLKAVAPTGLETIRVELAAEVTQVSVIGEKLAARRIDIDEMFTGPGRPIALISNVRVEYQPVPVPKAPAKKAPAPVKKTPAKK
jgi:hypothetical protein